MENKNFLAEIANIDKQAEKAIIDLFNQHNVDSVDVYDYGWVAVDCDFATFDIATIDIINDNVVLFTPFSGEYDIDELLGGEMSRLYHLLEDEMDNLTKDIITENNTTNNYPDVSKTEILAYTLIGLKWLEDNVTPNMGTLQDSAFGGIPALKTTICDILKK